MKNVQIIFSIVMLTCLLCFDAKAQIPVNAGTLSYCSVALAPVNGNCVDATVGATIFSIDQAPQFGTINFSNDGTFVYQPTQTQTMDTIVYKACNIGGVCDTGTIYIQLADVEGPMSDIVETFQVAAFIGTPQLICGSNLGNDFLANCAPNLFTVCMKNNPEKGSISFASPQCINYLPLQAGIDTIEVSYCGDAIGIILQYTCDGWVESFIGPCSRIHYYVNNAFNTTEPFSLSYDMTCDTTLSVGNLGYPTWNPPTINTAPTNGIASIVTDASGWGTLLYTPDSGFIGTDSVVIDCAVASQITCATGTYIFNVTCTNPAKEPVALKDIVIAPNPITQCAFQINNLPADAVVTCYDVVGREYPVYARLSCGLSWIFGEDIMMPSGIYFLRISLEGETVVRTVYKN